MHTPATDHGEKMDVDEQALAVRTDDTTPASLTPSSHARDDTSEILTPKRRYVGAKIASLDFILA